MNATRTTNLFQDSFYDEPDRVRRLGVRSRARFRGASTHWVELITAAAPHERAQTVTTLAHALAWQEVARGRGSLEALDYVARRCAGPRKVGLLASVRSAYLEGERVGEEYEAMMSSMG